MSSNDNAQELQPVRFSRLKLMGKSPAHYQAGVDTETGSMRKGSALHSYLLGDADRVQVYEGKRDKRVKAYAEDQGIAVPDLRPRELPNGEVRETRAWRREHLPLFEQVWDTYYAEKYATPMFLELGAA